MGKEENAIQKEILAFLYRMEESGLPVVASRTGVYKGRVKSGAYFNTGRKGWPDVTLCIMGMFVAFEVKTFKGEQSEGQNDLQKKVVQAGGSWYTVRSILEVCFILEEMIPGVNLKQYMDG